LKVINYDFVILNLIQDLRR